MNRIEKMKREKPKRKWSYDEVLQIVNFLVTEPDFEVSLLTRNEVNDRNYLFFPFVVSYSANVLQKIVKTKQY